VEGGSAGVSPANTCHANTCYAHTLMAHDLDGMTAYGGQEVDARPEPDAERNLPV